MVLTESVFCNRRTFGILSPHSWTAFPEFPQSESRSMKRCRSRVGEQLFSHGVQNQTPRSKLKQPQKVSKDRRDRGTRTVISRVAKSRYLEGEETESDVVVGEGRRREFFGVETKLLPCHLKLEVPSTRLALSFPPQRHPQIDR